jgi:hypothetical protein
MLMLSTPAGAQAGAYSLQYWPCELLHAFTLEMAAHGICVHESMMLGDAGYARQKLDRALTLNEPALDRLVERMLDYFEPMPRSS